MITLENEFITAAIAPKGAELQSLKNKATGMEYMWSGDAAYWGKFSPVLFPIVGTLKDDTYYYEDKAYTLPRHGFAREMVFTTEELSETEVLFSLSDTNETKVVYPFSFSFKLRYKLHNNTLSCSYEVYNPGEKELLFSVGAHPAFAVPLAGTGNYEDYFLQFSTPETLQRHKLDGGLIGSEVQTILTDNGVLNLDNALFYEDAIVLKKLQSTTITTGCYKHSHGIHFHFKSFPFFGIWAAKDAPFVCLEPWCGIADSITHNQQLKDKEGIVALAPNAGWERTWSVEFF